MSFQVYPGCKNSTTSWQPRGDVGGRPRFPGAREWVAPSAPISRQFSQNAHITQSSNLHTSRAVPVAGSLKKPVPERPQRLAVKPSAAQTLRVQASSFSVPIAVPAFQAMDTQLNALRILPVRARIVSGCLNAAFSRHFSTFYGSSVQAMDTQLDARHRRRTPTIHRGRAQRTIEVLLNEQSLPAHQIRSEGKHASTATLQHASAGPGQDELH